MRKSFSKARRNGKGSQIAEFAPVLTFFLLFIVFPVINLIYLGSAFGSAWYLNHFTVRELTLTNPTATGAATDAENRVVDAWLNTGLSHWIGVNTSNVQKKVQNTNLTYTPTVNPNFVALTTSVTVTPFFRMAVPGLSSIPGIGQDVTFSFTEQEPLEEKGQD
jgi:hypothetical protein